MSTLKTNNIAPYSGNTVYIDGMLLVSGSSVIISSSVIVPTGSENTVYADYALSTWLNPNDRYQTIDISAQNVTLSWYLPTGSYEGQTVNFVLKNDNTSTIGPDGVWIFVDYIAQNNGFYSSVVPWYPFKHIVVDTNFRSTATATWLNTAWYTDNDYFD